MFQLSLRQIIDRLWCGTALLRAVVLGGFILLVLQAPSVLAQQASEASVQMRQGEKLREVLDRYRDLGINIVSTSALLPGALRVLEIPARGQAPVDQILELLAPHGLTVEMLDESNGFVALAEPTPIASPDIEERSVTSEIEEIIVTSRYRLRRNVEVLPTADTLEQQALQAQPSLGRDALRGLQVLPGLASSGVSARHEFRGGAVNETLYRIDDVELLEPFHLGNLQALFSAINLNVIESADVYTAGFPVSLGNRLSGVVDLNPIEPMPGWVGGVDLNLVTTGADVAGGGDNWGVVGAVRQSVLQHTLGLFEQDYGEPRFRDAFVRAQYEGEVRQWTAGLLRSNDEVSVLDRDERGSADTDYQSLWLRASQDLGAELSVALQLSLTDIDNVRSGELNTPLFSIGSLNERREFSTLTLTNSWDWRPDSEVSVQAGWSVSRQRGDFLVNLMAAYGPLAMPLQDLNLLSQQSRVKRSGEAMSAFASASHRLSERIVLEVGVRFDSQDIDPVHSNDASARVSVDYQASQDLMLTINAGRYVQQQHLYEIQIDDGKAELDPPQRSDQVNLTAVWLLPSGVKLRSDAYFRDIDYPWSHVENLYNRWVLFPELAGDRFEIVPESARSYGWELQLAGDLGAHWSWSASYALSRTEEKYLGRTRARPWQQEHGLKASLRWRGERWRASLVGDYHSGRPTTRLLASSDDLSGLIMAEHLPDYFSVDLHVARVWPLRYGEAEAYLDVANLANRRNIGGYDYARAGHEQRLLPVTPTLGFSWRW